MTPAVFAAHIRYETKTNSTTFADADILRLANIFKNEIASKIVKTNEDYFGVPSTADLKANQREYPLPSDLLNQIKKVEAKLDGTNWIPLDEFDLNSYKRTTNESEITSQFSNNKGDAFYDIFRGSLWIYSGTIVAVTAGLKLWSFSWPADIADLTSNIDMSQDPSDTTHGFPQLFHELLARRVIIDYKESKEKPIPLTQHELSYKNDLQEALQEISPINLDRAVTGKLPAASERGNDGFDY